MNLILQFILSFILAFAVTPLIRLIAKKYEIVSRAGDDRWRKDPVPLLGGVSIWLTFILITALSDDISKEVIAIMIGSSGVFFLGFIDDVFGLNPPLKLIGQIVIASLMIASGIMIKIIPYPVISIPLTIFWIVAITNAFNLLDNMDGLSAGIASIASFILFLFSLRNGNLAVASLAIIITGSALGFLRYNFKPASIFMGDCGSMFIGFLLAVLAILGTWQHATNLVGTLLIPIMLLGIPIFDTSFVTITRKLKGVPVSQGGKDHISHRLVSLGVSEKKTILFLYIFSLSIGLASLYLINKPWLLAIAGIMVAIGFYVLGLFLGEKDRSRDTYEMKQEVVKRRSLRAKPIIFSKRRMVEILIDLILVTIAYFSAYLIRYEGVMSETNMELFINSLPWIIVIKFTVFSYMGLYESMWRYISIRDVMNIVKATVLSSLLIIAVILMFYRFKDYSRTVFIVDWLLTLILIGGVRLMLRSLREYLENYRRDGKRVIIIGAGDAGELVLREIRNNPQIDLRVIGFIDDNPRKHKARIHGVKVLGSTEDLSRLSREKNIDEVLIAIPSATEQTILRITDVCREANLKFGMFPVMKKLLDQIRNNH